MCLPPPSDSPPAGRQTASTDPVLGRASVRTALCALLMRIPNDASMRIMRKKSAADSAYRSAQKRATNVSIRTDLLEAAREAGVNLSATLERALSEELAARKRTRWREENREAIAAYNEHTDEHGAFSDGVRSF